IPKATEKGCVVIDKSSHYRLNGDVPLIVPEVNEHLIKLDSKIISSPNCCVIPLVVALSPLHIAAKIKRIVVSTYQSVSGAGKEGMDELYSQVKSTYMPDKLPPKKFEKQIAFNVIPKIDKFGPGGYTLEEEKIELETRKILGSEIKVTATCVRVPVFVGHCLSVNVEFENPISASEAAEILEESEGVVLSRNDSHSTYITPVEAAGQDFVYVSRLREDISAPNTLSAWISCDNIRKGAALNAVQIAETLIKLWL
ncbi:MAG: aspartate-semialdehyde dehydrogenase, partial [Rickettsiaceae bacterium]|nr:aspartate-semialdehyde dehydrogenase [Rickettsiaceae bacterium]